MASLLRAANRHVPPPVLAWLRKRRRSAVHRTTGIDIEAVAGDLSALRRDISGVLEQHQRDLLARQDTVLASYDQRVAALVNRVLDLEERLGGDAPPPAAGIGAHVARSATLTARIHACVEPDPDEARLREERVALHAPLLAGHAPVLHVHAAGVEAAGVEERDDPLVALARLPEGSAGGVTIVDVIEGLSLDDVDLLLRVAGRVVRSGGVIVVEARYPATPESLARFWRDPGRLRPWDAATVACLARHAGLEVGEVRRHPGPDADFVLVARRP